MKCFYGMFLKAVFDERGAVNRLEEKYRCLERFILEKGGSGVVVAFSGGVDSSTLTAVAHRLLGDRVVAVTASSATYPPEELEVAAQMAKEIGVKHMVVGSDELSMEEFCRNPENRCYYCKGHLLDRLLKVAEELGFKAVFEGTNLSDLEGHRPGFQAVRERPNVFSPWVEAGFTKDEIRTLAGKMGLSVADKPSYACLSSRIPFGERITEERLKRVWRAEHVVKVFTGARQVRVRDHNGLARIEVDGKERKLFFNEQVMDKLISELKSLGFNYVTLDLEGYRSGSMLHTLKLEEA